MRSYRLSSIGRVETEGKEFSAYGKGADESRIYIQWSETRIHFDRWTFENVKLTNIFFITMAFKLYWKRILSKGKVKDSSNKKFSFFIQFFSHLIKSSVETETFFKLL